MSFPDDAPRSKLLYERAKRSLPGGNTRTTVFMKPFPLYAAWGRGCRVWDADGVARIDCINNFTAGIHGHAHPKLISAATEQLELGTAFGLPTESEIELAELICQRVKSVERVRFMNSGTEAVMMALKAARARTGRYKIAKCEGAYHGSYDYAEVSLDPSPSTWARNAPNSVAYAKGTPEGVLSDVIILPFNDVEATTSIIREYGQELAAIIIDPLPNRAGLIPATSEYVQALRQICTEIGAIFIFDEVISFRLGYAGAQLLWDTEADLTCFGKIIGGGFPVGAVGGREDVMAVFDPSSGKPALPHGGTFSANPMTMRSGLAGMRLLDPEAFLYLDRIGARMRSGINEAIMNRGIPGIAVGMGSLLKIHFTDRKITDYRSAYSTAEESRRLSAFVLGLIDNGVLVAPNGLLALSTVMTEGDVDEVVSACYRALDGLD
jgi:glutamate-1-semialdehyde 2,1-aminomutase